MTGTDVETATACDWTVSGMDCGSCATKIKDAVGRLPGVSGVEGLPRDGTAGRANAARP